MRNPQFYVSGKRPIDKEDIEKGNRDGMLLDQTPVELTNSVLSVIISASSVEYNQWFGAT